MAIILGIAAVAGLVWSVVLMLRGSLLAGCAAFLAAASCLGAEVFSFDAAGLTWTLDRFFLIGLTAAFVVQWRLRRTDPKPVSRTELLLLLFVGVLMFSAFSHDWRASTPDQVPIVMHLVNGYLIPLAIYWIARNASLDERQLGGMYALLAAFGVYLALTALLEISGQWWLVFPRYIADPDLGIHFGRARGPMLQSARLGLYLVTCLAVIWIGWWILARGGRAGRLAAIAVTPLFMAAAYYTYTRSVWLGMALAFAVAAALLLRGRLRVVLLGGMAAAALLVAIAKGGDLIAFQREYTAAETRESTYMRASFAYVSWQMFKERPLTGFGFGQFARKNQPYLGDRQTRLRLESIRGYIHHNTLLSLLVETGLVGLVIFLAILGYWVRDGLALWRDSSAPLWARAHGLLLLAALAPYACQLVFREVSFSPVENSLIFLLAGVATGLRATFGAVAVRSIPAERRGGHADWRTSAARG